MAPSGRRNAKLQRDLERARQRVRELEARLGEEAPASGPHAPLLLDALQDGLIVTDMEGRVLDWRGGSENLFGYSREEMLGEDVARLHDEEETPLPRMIAAQREGSGAFSGQLRCRRKDGTPVIVQVVSRAVQDSEGTPIAMIGINRDVTRQTHKERELRDSEERYRTLFEAANDAILLMEGARVVDCNPMAERIYHTTRETLVGAVPWDLSTEVQYDGRPSREAALEWITAAQGGQAQTFAWSSARLDGTPFDAEVSLAPVALPGSPLMAIVRDVTERRKMEQALLESEERYRTLAENATDIISVHTLGGQILYVSPSVEAITGFTPEEYQRFTHFERVHPDDLEAVKQELASYREAGDVGEALFRLRHRDGRWLWMQSRATLLSSEAAEPQLLVVTREITREMEDRHHLEQSRHQLDLVLRGADLGFWDLDLNARRVQVNERTCDLFGYAPGEVGKELAWWVQHLAPGANEEAIQRAEEMLAGQRKDLDIELRIAAADGKERVLLTRGRVVEWEKGASPARATGTFLDITERKNMEISLQHFRRAVHAVGEMIVMVDSDCRYLFANPSYLAFYDLSEEEVAGCTLEEVLGDEVAERSRERLQRALAGEAYSVERVHLHPERGPCHLHVQYIPFREREEGPVTSVVVVQRDETERLRTQRELRRSKELMDKTGQIARVGGWELNLKTEEVIWSRITCLLLGYPEDYQPALEEAFSTYHPEDREQVRELVAESAESGDPFQFEARILPRSGDQIWVRVRGEAEWEDGEVVKLNGTLQDITALKREEEERRAYEEKLRQTQKLESLGVLAGGVAHDFNNLLVGILGNAELALQELPSASPARPLLEEVTTATGRAADLAKQMLAYSGKGRFVVETVSLNELVTEMKHILEASISKRVRLQLDLDHRAPLVEGDATQLRQVVMNLVINGAEAMEEGEGVVRLSTGRLHGDRGTLNGFVMEEELPEGEYAFLEVHDSGAGMDAETKEKVFDPFFSTKFTGRGLGLAAVLGIVRSHGGAISLQSEPGIGTTFRILLPPTEKSLRAESAPGEPAEPARENDATILFVDDEETVRRVGERMLRRLGYQVVVAGDGEEALAIYRERGQEVSAVLLDLTMPRMGGEETFQRLRELSPDLPIVLASGYDQSDVVRRFKDQSVDGFVEKPFRLASLVKVLEQALADR